ncbi:MAG: PrsW family glutamic-type intramembrane protease [Pyrinomonadaceae bacterium]
MKLRLTITSGTLNGQTFELETGFLSIGRSETCSVRFDPSAERIASKQHAFIEAKQDGFYIRDNASTNGTLVNDSRVETAKLNHGDSLQFGRNGTTGTVIIEPTITAPAIAPFEFQQIQNQQFQQAEAEASAQFQAQQSVPTRSIAQSLGSLGLGNIEQPKTPPPNKTGLYIGVGIATLLFVVLGALVAGLFVLLLEPVPAVLATAIAFTPALLYIIPLVGLDRYDPEPFWLLAFAFAWGAIVSVLVSFVGNTVFGGFAAVAAAIATGVPELGSIITAVISAPLFEESSKGFGLLILLIFLRRYFDDILDGIVYAGVIALGFATVENVLYYGTGLNQAYKEFGLSSEAFWSFMLLFTLRGILSPFAHVTFTAMTGIGCGISRESHNWFVRIAMPMLGWTVAMILHGLWNGLGIVATVLLVSMGMEPTCAAIGLGGQNVGLCGFFTFYLLLEVPLFFIFMIFAFFIMRRQRRILNDMLALDVARGLITEPQLKTITSVFKSTSWLIGGIFSGKFFARSRFQRAVGKLGLSYWHIQRATAAQGHTGSFQQNPILRDEVLRWRDKI